MVATKARGYLTLTGVIESAEEGGYSSVCPELAVASQGETIDEALSRLQEAVRVYLDTISELGDLEHVLARRALKPGLLRPNHAVSLKVRPGSVVSSFIVQVGPSSPD